MKLLLPLLFTVTFSLQPVLSEDRNVSKQITLTTGEIVDYLFYSPTVVNANESLPVVLFLHGGGESGDDLEKVKTHGFPRRIAEGVDYPMIVIAPLNPDKKGFWDEDRLARFLDEITADLKFDRNRLYLAGMSRGANGAYRLAMENPDRFAGILVTCGAAPAPYANWLGKIPVWIVHGEKDPVIPVDESIRMAGALKKKGGEVKLTIHPEASHDVWTTTFDDPDILQWLLAQKREPVSP